MNHFDNPGGIIGTLLTLAILGGIYFTPAIIARHKKNSGTIFLCNLFLGATGVGWVVCLIWALRSEYEEVDDK